jgi:TP901 family phage tail tape measure protein
MAADGRIEIDTRLNSEGVDKGIEEINEKLSKAGEGMKEVGENLSTYVSAPLAALGGVALKVASDFSDSQGKLQAQLGISAEEAKKLNSVAEDVWKNGFGEDVADAADAVALVHKNMQGIDGKELDDATKAAFTLRDAFGFEVEESTRSAKALMDQFGLTGEKAFDLITVAAQKGGDYSGELLDTISEYSTQFSSMGFQAEDMFNILIKGAQNGAFNLDKVGDAVKEFNIRAQDGSKTTSDGFKLIGLDAEDMGGKIAAGGEEGKKAFMATVAALAAIKDPVKQNAAGVALFGTQWEDLRSTVVTSMGDTSNALGNVEGATKKASDAMNESFGAKLQTLWRGLLDSLKPLGDILLNMAEQWMPKISAAIDAVSTAFTNLSPGVQQIVIFVGLFLAALGPILVIVGNLITSITAVIEVLIPLGTWLFGAGEATGALAAAITTLSGPVGWVIAAVVALIAIIVALWQNNEEFRAKVIEIWTGIQQAFWTALAFVKNIVVSVMTSVWSFIQSILSQIQAFWKENGAQIMAIVRGWITYISALIQVGMGVIKGVFQIVWPIITNVVKLAWSLIKTVIGSAIQAVLGVIQVALKLLKGDWSGAWNTIKSTAETIWHNIVGFFKGIDLYKYGKDILQGLIDGFNSMVGSVKKAVEKISSLIPDGVKKFLHIKSPSRKMKNEVGKWVPLGLAQGIDENADVVAKSAKNMAEKAIPTSKLSGAAIANKISQTISPVFTGTNTISMPDNVAATVNIGGYEAKALIQYISNQQNFITDRKSRF